MTLRSPRPERGVSTVPPLSLNTNMKIYELLNPSAMPGSATPGTSPSPSMGAPMAKPPMPPSPSASAQPNMQTAGLGDTVKNFFSTPQPIGGSQPASPVGQNTGLGDAIANSVPGVSTINSALSGAGKSSEPPK